MPRQANPPAVDRPLPPAAIRPGDAAADVRRQGDPFVVPRVVYPPRQQPRRVMPSRDAQSRPPRPAAGRKSRPRAGSGARRCKLNLYDLWLGQGRVHARAGCRPRRRNRAGWFGVAGRSAQRPLDFFPKLAGQTDVQPYRPALLWPAR